MAFSINLYFKREKKLRFKWVSNKSTPYATSSSEQTTFFSELWDSSETWDYHGNFLLIYTIYNVF